MQKGHENLKDFFVNEMVQQILTGKLQIGDKLPSERVISENMKISRNVVRVGLSELAALGFLHTEARKGTFVTDYLREGNILTLDAVRHAKVPTTPKILNSMLDFRWITLCESAAQCALHRTGDDLERLRAIIDEQSKLDNTDNEAFVRLDFIYQKEIYIVSGNILYPMIQNSISAMHHTLALEFYKMFADKEPVKKCHREIYRGIEQQDPDIAKQWMREVLQLGNDVMAQLSYLGKEGNRD
jgi:DNA-binding FadR family transcriptional regulator